MLNQPYQTELSSLRSNAIRNVLGSKLHGLVANANLLVVGAGGIGCELLKNLVLTGFQRIHIIDLDVIDVSNLNRQFLFRHKHVSMSKAQVAREAVLKFNPTVSIIASHANIKDPQFNADFFAQFSIVMNALDNLEARRHVNRICIAKQITLIESGTQGYIGQTTVIRKGVTECFECHPKMMPKSFAICTIRNTPDKPVHCVVWAKHIFGVLFGPDNDSNMLSDTKKDLAQGNTAFALLNKLFVHDVEKARDIESRWVSRKAPEPIHHDDLVVNKETTNSEVSESSVARQQRVLSVKENISDFCIAFNAIHNERQTKIGLMQFDKDDDLAMQVVSTLANLRMHVYHIDKQSHFCLKGIAGNIVHAIATTNAIAAGLVVLEAMKVLNDNIEKCVTVWIKKTGPKVLQPQRIDEPNPKCFVCRKNTLELYVDTGVFTLRDLFRYVLVKNLGMNEPSIDVENRDNYIGSEDDHADGNYLCRVLNDSGVRINEGAILSVDDLSQSFECTILVFHRDNIDEDEVPDRFLLSGKTEAPSSHHDKIEIKLTNGEAITSHKHQTTKSDESPRKKRRKIVTDINESLVTMSQSSSSH